MPRTTKNIPDAESIADWIEGFLISTGRSQCSLAKVRETSSRHFEIPGIQADFAIRVMVRRQQILIDKYPFEIQDVGIKRRDGYEGMPYVGLVTIANLLIGNSGPEQQTKNIPITVEELARAAMINLLGEGAEGVRFGWPSDVGRPAEFPSAIHWLANKMGIKEGSAYRPPRMKDGGVDVVVWKSFRDNKPGFPILLGQVTTEKDFPHKATDIDLRVWSGWLCLDVSPIVVLAVPWTLSEPETWNAISTRALLLDRIRLACLLPHRYPSIISPNIVSAVGLFAGMMKQQFSAYHS